MSASFKSHSFKEGGEGATRFPVWNRKAKSAVLELPGANNDIIQKFGRKSDTLALLATCTKSQLDTLFGDVGSTGSLIFHYGTFNGVPRFDRRWPRGADRRQVRRHLEFHPPMSIQDITFEVRIAGRIVPNVLEVASSTGFDQINAQATIWTTARPSGADERQEVTIWAKNSVTGQGQLFGGEVTGFDWDYAPTKVGIVCGDLLARTRDDWGDEDAEYTSQTSDAVVRNVLEKNAIPRRRPRSRAAAGLSAPSIRWYSKTAAMATAP
jgi:hypothetical protein